MFDALINAAIRAEIITKNPFSYPSGGAWDPPATNNDRAKGLTVDQLRRLIAAHPPHLRVIPALSTFAMLRVGEFWGLERQQLPVPPENRENDDHEIVFELVKTYNSFERKDVPVGKTRMSL